MVIICFTDLPSLLAPCNISGALICLIQIIVRVCCYINAALFRARVEDARISSSVMIRGYLSELAAPSTTTTSTAIYCYLLIVVGPETCCRL